MGIFNTFLVYQLFLSLSSYRFPKERPAPFLFLQLPLKLRSMPPTKSILIPFNWLISEWYRQAMIDENERMLNELANKTDSTTENNTEDLDMNIEENLNEETMEVSLWSRLWSLGREWLWFRRRLQDWRSRLHSSCCQVRWGTEVFAFIDSFSRL